MALADDPGPFAAVADHHATESALASLYAELSNVAPATLDHLEREGGPTARTAVRFCRAIAGHLRDFHDEAAMARAAAGRVDLAAVLGSFGHVIWYLPAPLTRPLGDVLAAVLRTAPSTALVGTTGDTGADASVRRTCELVGVDLPAVPSADTRPTAQRIVSVTDADEEVRAVVREVAALAERGVRLDRIGIFHPTPDPYVGVIEQQLAAAGIPANGPSRRRLADTVAGRTLLRAIELPSERWRRDKVMALVSGGPLRAGDERVHPARWESLTREAGVVQDVRDWRAKLAGHRLSIERSITEPPRDVDDAWVERRQRDIVDVERLAQFVDELAEGVRRVERAHGWPDKAAAAKALLHQLLGDGHQHRRWPDAEQLAFERIEDVLVRLATLGELEPDPSHDVFVRALSAEVDVTRGRSGRFGEGVVYGPLAGAAGHDLDAVFIVGCSEGLWPTARRDDVLLPDAIRSLAAGQLELRAARLDDQHRAFLVALAAAPAGARTLTFARGDLRGNRSALPSRWLLDSASVLAGRTVHATDFADLGPPSVELVPSFARGLDAAVHGSLDERDLAVLAQFADAGGAVLEHPISTSVGRGFEAQAARRSEQFTEWDGNLGGQPLGSGDDRPMSPTRLERWSACGFRYFLSHVLGLRDRDDPERVVDLSPLDRGSGVHLVLERFIGEAIDKGPPTPDEPWSAADRARLREIADEVFADQESRGRTGRPILWKVAKAELFAVLDEFSRADDRYRAETGSTPIRVELPFGFDDSEPVQLTLPSGRTMSFHGFADRVDRASDDHLLVTDYKTGKGDQYVGLSAADPVREGTTLQLGLYAEAARQLLGAESTEAHYWMVDPRADYKRHGYEWTADRRERFIAVLETIVAGIDAGVFLVDPGEWDIFRGTYRTCAFCEFDRLCVRDRGEQFDVKVEAPALRVRDALAWTEEP